MENKCPLCDRSLGDINISYHHLIPKLKGGKDKYAMHLTCHRAIHSALTESELANYYHTWDRLKQHPDIARFVAWIKKKPLDFVDSFKETNSRKSKRR